MVPSIFFVLFATAFAAVVPNVKRDAFQTISGEVSLVDNALTKATNDAATLLANDSGSIDAFQKDFIDMVDTINNATVVIEDAIKNQPSPDDDQAQQLTAQLTGVGASIGNLVNDVLGKEDEIAASNLICFVQQTSKDFETAMTAFVLAFFASSDPADAAADVDVITDAISQLQNVGSGKAACSN